MDIDGQQLADQISGYLAEKAWEHAEGKKLRAARAFNRSMGGEFICAMCEAHTQHPANYCGLCGCALPK